MNWTAQFVEDGPTVTLSAIWFRYARRALWDAISWQLWQWEGITNNDSR